MATQVMTRRLLRDNALTITQALPGVSGNNTSAAIDIGTGPWNPEQIQVEVSIPAMTGHVTVANKLQIQLYSGATAGALALADPFVETDQPGIVTTGTPAKVVTFKLPTGTPRFIAFHHITGITDDLSATSVTYTVLV